MWSVEITHEPPKQQNWQSGDTLSEDIRNKICRIYHNRMMSIIIALSALFVFMFIPLIQDISIQSIIWPMVFFMLGLLIGIYAAFCIFSARKVMIRQCKFDWTELTVDDVHIFAGVRGTIRTCVDCDGRQYKIYQFVGKFKKGDTVLCISSAQGVRNAFKI